MNSSCILWAGIGDIVSVFRKVSTRSDHAQLAQLLPETAARSDVWRGRDMTTSKYCAPRPVWSKVCAVPYIVAHGEVGALLGRHVVAQSSPALVDGSTPSRGQTPKEWR